MGDCEGGLRGTLPVKQVGGEERGEGEELSPAEGVGEGVWTKRKRVFGCFRTGNIRATLHLSQPCTCIVLGQV